MSAQPAKIVFFLDVREDGKDVSVNPFFLSKEHHPYGAKPCGRGEYRYLSQEHHPYGAKPRGSGEYRYFVQS